LGPQDGPREGSGVKLTEKTIASLICASGQKDRLVFDDAVPGLGVRISASGSKGFLVQFRTAPGGKRRLPIGSWGSVTLEQARQAAKGILGQVAAGRDPYAERKALRENAKVEAEADRLTLEALLSDWSEIGLSENSMTYRKEAVRALSAAFGDFLNRRADALKRADAVRVLDGLVKAGKVAIAGRTRAYGRACYSWAIKRGTLDANPFADLPIPTSTKSRDRVLSDMEVGAIYRTAQGLGYPFGPLLQLLMLTAQRRDEVAGMRWSEISTDGTTWKVPAERAKNRKANIVHLSPEVRAILAAIRRNVGTDLVFSTNQRTAVSGFSKVRERLGSILAAAAEPVVDDWRLHDFRRSCVTWLAGAGFNTAVADKILNHATTTGLTTVGMVYQRAEYLPERLQALEAWARHVVACADKRPDEGALNVVPMRRP
jgi:integrase